MQPRINSLASGSCTFLLLALTATSGCSSAPATHPVNGRVVWQGGGDAKELAGYGVSLESEDGKTSASGEIGPDGTFTVGTFDVDDGALAGKHRVLVSPPDPELDKPPPPRLIPKRYSSFDTSNLTMDIKPGRNDVVLEVERNKQ